MPFPFSKYYAIKTVDWLSLVYTNSSILVKIASCYYFRMDIDFQSYLQKFGEGQDPSSDDEDETRAELEAELYSKIHYEEAVAVQHINDAQLPPKEISDNLSLDLFNEIIRVKSASTSPQPPIIVLSDSGVSSPNSEERSRSPKRSEVVEEDSKYDVIKERPASSLTAIDVATESDSEEDSGIKVLEYTASSTSKTCNSTLDIVDLVASESSDSDIEHLPCFRVGNESRTNPTLKPAQPPKQRHEKLIVETPKNTSRSVRRSNNGLKVVKGNSFNKHFRIKANSSSSSDDSSDLDDGAILDSNIHLNVRGHASAMTRSFSQVTSSERIIANAGNDVTPKIWTPDMVKFYDDVDPEMADMTNEKLMASLPHGGYWTVKKPHATPSRHNTPTRYFHGRKCTNCNHEGHSAKSCPEPKRRLICYMCAEEGHSSYRCPRQHCMRCGEPGEPYTLNCRKCRYLDSMDCRLCGGRGHIQSQCPDIWRRYHATTTPNQGIVQPEPNVHLPLRKIWCSNCARQGHYLHQCRSYSYSSTPPPVLSVVSYREPHQYQLSSTIFESKASKKRRLRDELKAKKRAYRSLPSTPSIVIPPPTDAYSEPVTPVYGQVSAATAKRVLMKAKKTLEILLDDEEAASKNWRGKKRQKKRGLKEMKTEHISLKRPRKKKIVAEEVVGDAETMVHFLSKKMKRANRKLPEVREVKKQLRQEIRALKRTHEPSSGVGKSCHAKLMKLSSRLKQN
jgi:hypothetical protein